MTDHFQETLYLYVHQTAEKNGKTTVKTTPGAHLV